MNEDPGWKRVLRVVPGVVAIAILCIFLLRAFGLLAVPRNVVVTAYLALGPLGMIGSLELGRFLAAENGAGDGGGAFARAGAVFGASAFLLWEVVHAIQLGASQLWREQISGRLVEILPEGETAVRLLYRGGVSAVQATTDVAFDVFFCLAIVAFSVPMFRHVAFGWPTGVFGMLAGGGLLLLNLWSFPFPPAEAGLWDLGPATVVWWILVIVQWQRHKPGRSATRRGDDG